MTGGLGPLMAPLAFLGDLVLLALPLYGPVPALIPVLIALIGQPGFRVDPTGDDMDVGMALVIVGVVERHGVFHSQGFQDGLAGLFHLRVVGLLTMVP